MSHPLGGLHERQAGASVAGMSVDRVIPMPSRQGLTAIVSTALRGILAERRITGVSLASHVGMSQSKMSRRLTGEFPFDTDELERVLGALEISLADLLARASNVTAPVGPRPPTPTAGEGIDRRLRLVVRPTGLEPAAFCSEARQSAPWPWPASAPDEEQAA